MVYVPRDSHYYHYVTPDEEDPLPTERIPGLKPLETSSGFSSAVTSLRRETRAIAMASLAVLGVFLMNHHVNVTRPSRTTPHKAPFKNSSNDQGIVISYPPNNSNPLTNSYSTNPEEELLFRHLPFVPPVQSNQLDFRR